MFLLRRIFFFFFFLSGTALTHKIKNQDETNVFNVELKTINEIHIHKVHLFVKLPSHEQIILTI